MIVIRTTPFPKCQFCGKRMDYSLFGQDDKDASHPECWGRNAAMEVSKKLKLKINL